MRSPLLASSALVTLGLLVGSACTTSSPTPGPTPTEDPGALVGVTMQTEVGVLLDELPASAREAVAGDLLAQPPAFWEARARRQIEAALYRLVYRNFYYDDRLQLPLPPAEQWKLTVGTATRATVDGHDVVLAPYTFESTLLSPLDEPAKSDPALATVGGSTEEAFVLPIDPEHLLERTGFACMNESDFPPNSVDTENARFFFDDTCTVAPPDCHLTEPLPTKTCEEALTDSVGRATAVFRFERLAWSAAKADEVRVGEQVPGGPQMRAMPEGVADHRIVYRYFPEDSCAIVEGCVGASGWRRLLQFTASVQNLGDTDMALGDVGEGSLAVENKLVSPSECHGHMHFNHYGRFTFGEGGEQLGSKRAFCLESTSRYFNNEKSLLTHPYSCSFQGTAAGWGDDYIAGLDCQWVDVTPVDSTGGATAPLTFHYNADGFLCEGALVLDAEGNPTFEPTEFLNEQGENESKFACTPLAGADDDNVATAPVTLPDDQGGLLTEPCSRYQVGDKKNCGFARLGTTFACTPGETVTLACDGATEAAPAVVRACEASQVLGGIPCLFREALGNTVATGAITLEVTCPSARDASETGGLLSVFVAPVADAANVGAVTCALQ